MSFSLPKYLAKRMFQKGESYYLVRKDDAPAPNYIMFQSLNIIMPIEVPFPGLENFNFNDLSNYAEITIDGHPLKITAERFKNDILYIYKDHYFNAEYIERFISGQSVDSYIIPLGARSSLLIKIQEDLTHATTIGEHVFKVKIHFGIIEINVEVTFELTPENANRDFNSINIQSDL
jgi:hypothetical protein